MVTSVSQLSVAEAIPPVIFGVIGVLHSTVIFGGQVIIGSVVSVSVMICVHTAILPQSSVADQLRVMMLSQSPF